MKISNELLEKIKRDFETAGLEVPDDRVVRNLAKTIIKAGALGYKDPYILVKTIIFIKTSDIFKVLSIRTPEEEMNERPE